MEFSTEAIEMIAEIMVAETERIDLANEGIRLVETSTREFLRVVGAKVLGQYLEEKDEQFHEAERVFSCGGQLKYLFKRQATILSVFGRVRYRRGYHAASSVMRDNLPWIASWASPPAGLAKLLALAGVEVALEEATRWREHYLLFRVSDNTLRKETE